MTNPPSNPAAGKKTSKTGGMIPVAAKTQKGEEREETDNRTSRPQSSAESSRPVSVASNAKSKSGSESSSSSYDILRQQLKIALSEISRQKLRNIQIHMRRIANVDSRVKSSDLWEVFMEHGFPINKRTFQLLMDHFSDSFGVEYESIVKLLKDTHARTGRDSVQAKFKVSGKDEVKELVLESDADEDLLRDIKDRFVANTLTQFSLSGFESQLEQLDYTKSGVLSKKEVRKVAESMQLPIYGHLISQLYNRCDPECNSQISWPLLLNFLEAAIGGTSNRVKVVRAKEEEVTNDHEIELDQSKIEEFRKKQEEEDSTKKAVISGMLSKDKRPFSGKSLFSALKGIHNQSVPATSGSDTEDGGTKRGSDSKPAGVDLKSRLQSAATLDKQAEASEAKLKAISSTGMSERIKVYQRVVATSPPGSTSPNSERSLSPRLRRPSYHPVLNAKISLGSKLENDRKFSEPAPTTRRASAAQLQQKKLNNEKVSDADKSKADNSKLLEKRTSINKAILKSAKGNDSLQNGYASPTSKSGSKATDASSTDESKNTQQKENSLRKSPTLQGKGSEKKSSPILLPGQTKYAISGDNAKKDPSSSVDKTEKNSNGKTSNSTENQPSKLADVPEVFPAEKSAPSEQASVTEVNKNKNGKASPRDHSKGKHHKSKQSESGLEKYVLTTDGDTKSEYDTNGLKNGNDLNEDLPNASQEICNSRKRKKRRQLKPSSSSVSDKPKSGATSTDRVETEESGPEKVLINVLLPTTELGERPSSNEKEDDEIEKNNISSPRVVTTRPKSGKSLFKKPEKESSLKKRKKKGKSPEGESETKTVGVEMEQKNNLSHSHSKVEPLDLKDLTSDPVDFQVKLKKAKNDVIFQEVSVGKELASKLTPNLINTRSLNQQHIEDNEFKEPIYPPAPKGIKPTVIEVDEKTRIKVWPPDDLSLKLIEPQTVNRSLKMDWIYGYRGNDCRNNLHIVTTGELLYNVSTFAILFDRKSWQQRFYTEHKGNITSLAVHPEGVLVASGQEDQADERGSQQQKTSIRVWDCITLNTVVVISHAYLKGGVSALTFSNTKNYLLSADGSTASDGTHLCVWNCHTGALLQSAILHVSLVCSLAAYVTVSDDPEYPDRMWIVTAGKEYLMFHIYNCKSREIIEDPPIFGRYGDAKFFVTAVFNSSGRLHTGDSNGNLLEWDSGKGVHRYINSAHEGSIFSIVFTEDKLLITGGRDGVIKIWGRDGPTFYNQSSFRMPEDHGACRALAQVGSSIYIGSTANSVLVSSLKKASNEPSSSSQSAESTTNQIVTSISDNWSIITQGHYEQIRGTTVLRNPLLGGHFFTAGYDGIVIFFDSEQHRIVWKHSLKNTAPTCIDVHNDSSTVAMGTKDGSLILVKVRGNNRSTEVKVKVAKSKINCIKFCKDYSSVALGSEDGNTYIFRSCDFTRFEEQPPEEIAKCSSQSGPIVNVDWSEQMRQGHFIIRTLTREGVIKHWNSGTAEQWLDSEMRNVSWLSVNCMYEFNTSGLWAASNAVSTPALSTVCRHENALAAGTEKGFIQLAQYPCLMSSNKVAPKMLEQRAFHSLISSLEFVRDNIIVCVSSSDHCIEQWKIIN